MSDTINWCGATFWRAGSDPEVAALRASLAALESSARECALALASKTEEAERMRRIAERLFRLWDGTLHGDDFWRERAAALNEAERALASSPESAPAPDAGAASGPCRCTGIGPNPSHKPPCAPAPDADAPLDGWPCVECGRAGEACVCGPCGVLGCRNYSPCPVHDTDAHARDVRRLDERDRVVGAPRAPAPESAPAPDAEARLAAFVARYQAVDVACSVMAGPDVDSDVPWRMTWRRTYPDGVVSDDREVDGTSFLDVVAQAESWEAENDAREPEHAAQDPMPNAAFNLAHGLTADGRAPAPESALLERAAARCACGDGFFVGFGSFRSAIGIVHAKDACTSRPFPTDCYGSEIRLIDGKYCPSCGHPWSDHHITCRDCDGCGLRPAPAPESAETAANSSSEEG